jgi:hypothetical protein
MFSYSKCKFYIACVLAFLASCGGGGGGQSPPSASPAVISSKVGSVVVDLAPIGLKYIQGDDQSVIGAGNTSTSLVKNISIEGVDLNDPPEELVLGYIEDNASTQNNFILAFEQIDSKRIRTRFSPSSALTPGEYTGTFQLIACFAKPNSEECETHLTGSPSAKVPYKITVFPRLFLQDQHTSSAFAYQGRTTPIAGETSLQGTISKDDLIAQITYSPNASQWLTLTRTDTGFAYSINSKDIVIGTHTATVKMSSQASNQAVTKTIELVVGVNSFSGMQTASRFDITDLTVAADLKSEITVAIDNSDIAIPWKAEANVPWIVFDKATGLSGEKIIYHISTPYVATMPTETYLSQAGSTATITVSNESTFTIVPLTVFVEVHRLTSQVQSPLSAPSPINSPNFPIYFAGKNLLSGTLLEATGPSTLTFQIGGGLDPGPNEKLSAFPNIVPTIPGVYSVRTKNALGLPTQAVTLTFLADSQHTYSFIATPGYKRGMAYDQTRDALYVADKTNSQLLRFNHTNGLWATTQLAMPNISDLGLSQDRNRLYVSKTTGSLSRIDAASFTTDGNYTYGKPFPEYKTLSQNLQVLGLGQDFIPILTELTSPGGPQLSGIVSFSSVAGSFLPVQGYGYKPEQGGWFARGNNPDLAYFTQANPTPSTLFDSDYGTYAGLLFQTSLSPSAFNLAYSTLAPFQTLDVGMTTDGFGFGLANRARFISTAAVSAELPALPTGYRTVGSALSPDWKYIYLLTYPVAAINGDLPTTLTPRVYVYQVTSDYFPKVALLPTYFEFSNYPTCRRPSDASCILDTVSSVTVDGRTLFFAGDKGIAVVPIPNSFRTSATPLNKATLPNRLVKPALIGKPSGAKNLIRFIRH